MRYHLQRIGTGEWMSRDFDELAGGVRTRALSGPGGISGNIAPELKYARYSDGLRLLEPWATAIYAESDDDRITGGIVTDVSYDGTGKMTVDAPGFATYPTGIKYTHATNFGPQVDPLNIVRHLWDHVQSFSNGNLGVVVDATTSSRRIGDNAEPYALVWWENKDCGQEIDSLAKETPFDYAEQHTWGDANRQTVNHRLRLGFPRLGRRRDDLRFIEGVNVTNAVAVTTSGSGLANDIIGVGKGEGAAMIYTNSALIDGRLRRTAMLTDKTATLRQIQSQVATAIRTMGQIDDVTNVSIVDHPVARISAIDPGDDVFIDLDQPSFGKQRLLVRVLSIAESEDGTTAELSTRRASSFSYSATQEVG